MNATEKWKDLLPAADSSLAWRWTRASHSLFAAEDLAQVGCFSAEAAKLVNREALNAIGRDGLMSPPTFGLRHLKVPASGERELVSGWLAGLRTGPTGEVVASWSAETALLIPWALFVRRWNDFCYPGSDDVAVFPRDRAWVLAYHHDDAFEWGLWRVV